MTKEEHISNLETIGCDGWTVTTEAYKSLQFAIKTLEQEPCEGCDYKEWLKGEVEPKTDVLGKIKAEIKKNILDVCAENGTNAEMACYNSGLLKCIEIIDKYKAESEG